MPIPEYDLDKPVTVTLPQSYAAVLFELCQQIEGSVTDTADMFVPGWLEASLERERDFIFDARYDSIMRQIRASLKRTLES